MSVLRAEYPRPQFVRADWMNLNGEWSFDFDDQRVGVEEGWHQQHTFGRTIQVPFCYESALSGIGETDYHDVVWYHKRFVLPENFANKQTVLHIGAADYEAVVWINGIEAVRHEGGHVPFSADITRLLREGENEVAVRVEDYSKDLTLPRGKQYWKEQSASIFYTRTTGIWQSVWLEAVAPVHLKRVQLTPNIDMNSITIEPTLNGLHADQDVRLHCLISRDGQLISEESMQIRMANEMRTIRICDPAAFGTVAHWSPEAPNLYDIEYHLYVDGQLCDKVVSYFGMRKVSVGEDGKLLLNNVPYYLRFVLDQGYFPEGILTAPSDEALRGDVELTKAMGFNGVRKHQKVEDPRFLYWCDQLGLLVWGEMANSYEYSSQYVQRITAEWQEVVTRDYNHPSIMAWVPINESWGVGQIATQSVQRNHALAMYHLTKSLDAMRPVISNDGWEHAISDLCTIHDYEWREEVLSERYGNVESILAHRPAGRYLYAPGHGYRGEPILVTEFGGISFKKSDWEGWGYSGASDDEDFLKRLQAVVKPMVISSVVQGFCYTQLTDVEQEINGLLTYDRTPKVPLEQIRAIISQTR